MPSDSGLFFIRSQIESLPEAGRDFFCARPQKISPRCFFGTLYLPISLYTTYFTGSIRLITVQQFFRLTVLCIWPFFFSMRPPQSQEQPKTLLRLPPPWLPPPVIATGRPVPTACPLPRPSSCRIRPCSPHPSSDAAPVLGRRTRPRAPNPSPPRPSLPPPVPISQPPSSAPALVQRDSVLVVVIK